MGALRGSTPWSAHRDSVCPLLLLAQVSRRLDLFELAPVSTPSCQRLACASPRLSPGSSRPPLTHKASFPSLLHSLPWDKRERATGFRFWFYEKRGTKTKLCLSFATSLSQKRQDCCGVRLPARNQKETPPLNSLSHSSAFRFHTQASSLFFPFAARWNGVVPCTYLF